MCGIVDTNGTLDLHKLARDLVKELPPYAKPVFLRIMTSMDMTGTFKMKKTELQKEGFNPNNVKYDQIYYLDPKAGTYLPVDNDVYRRICSGEIRL
ncbi:long-chain fatty acid transport protein 1-like [Hyposmocoma kahamanoa]|uniref:long-chain fatty acid transport protein 1-like n=1 Tax=Hyposmocoma kahamanoa TaxID=1477025 RepID=UPI000E6D9D64|nr:long-chain fatty acid transport protein 1-like [Hyposmocoma kahamanoa]